MERVCEGLTAPSRGRAAFELYGAVASAAVGDEEKATRFYQRFIKLWQNCDPEAQPLLAEAQGTLYRLSM